MQDGGPRRPLACGDVGAAGGRPGRSPEGGRLGQWTESSRQPREALVVVTAGANPSRQGDRRAPGGLPLVCEQPRVMGRTPRSAVPKPLRTFWPSTPLFPAVRTATLAPAGSPFPSQRLRTLCRLCSQVTCSLPSRPWSLPGCRPCPCGVGARHRLAGSPVQGGGLSKSLATRGLRRSFRLSRPFGSSRFAFHLVSSASFSLRPISSVLLFQPVRVRETPCFPGGPGVG